MNQKDDSIILPSFRVFKVMGYSTTKGIRNKKKRLGLLRVSGVLRVSELVSFRVASKVG